MKRFAILAIVAVFGVVTASAGTLGVAGFSDGGGQSDGQLFPSTLQATWLALKNNSGATQTYSVLYFGLAGNARTPAANTFTVGANASVGWRPVATDTNEVTGIPNATGTFGAGSASILYTESPAPSGAVRVFEGTNKAIYSWSMIP